MVLVTFSSGESDIIICEPAMNVKEEPVVVGACPVSEFGDDGECAEFQSALAIVIGTPVDRKLEAPVRQDVNLECKVLPQTRPRRNIGLEKNTP